MEEHLICQWCLTEIVWDDEIGPETHCPHCDNELSAYRTIELGYDEEEVEADEHERAVQALKINDVRRASQQNGTQDEWSEDGIEDEDGDGYSDEPNHDLEDGFRSADRTRFAVEESIQRVLDDQDEVPECPVCRTYMIEAGVQLAGDRQFESRIVPSLDGPVLKTPFKLNLYVCPACYHTASLLSPSDREQMIKRLSPAE